MCSMDWLDRIEDNDTLFLSASGPESGRAGVSSSLLGACLSSRTSMHSAEQTTS